MVITSYGFLLLFLPFTALIYWRIQHKLFLLCVISFIFYALAGLEYVPLLVGLSLITYWLARRGQTGFGIAINLAALAFFKYWNFGVQSTQAITTSLGLQPLLPLLTLALPLGISFYVFKHIGYLLDIRAGRFHPASSPLLFLTYSAFFPQITAGPMSVSDDTLKQFANLPKSISAEQVYQALVFISIGLVKKILIADPLSHALNNGLFAAGDIGSGALWAWSSVGIYALQLYFDFSAYTDIVLGVGSLFGIHLPPNFNNPYLATNPADFWTRWHISLSTWFRFYLFFPLSRSLLKRLGTQRSETAQYTANFVTMGLVGLWHGAGWGYVLWGLYHGLLLNSFAWAKRRRVNLDNHILLMVCILIGWALFLSPTLEFAGQLLSNMAGLAGFGSIGQVLTLYPAKVWLRVVAAVLLTATGFVEAANFQPLSRPVYALVLGVLTVLCIIHLGNTSTFVYAQF
jgi:alginate O-acetyltransferase complex protein AlgI